MTVHTGDFCYIAVCHSWLLDIAIEVNVGEHTRRGDSRVIFCEQLCHLSKQHFRDKPVIFYLRIHVSDCFGASPA